MGSPPTGDPTSLESRLFEEGYNFDFFQAVRLLHRLDPGRSAVGRAGPPGTEAVRFRAHASLSFPPSAIHDLKRPSVAQPLPVLTQAFLGLTGPSGVLPRHYTELLYRLERDAKGPEKEALRDWLDLFNHRLVSLFYRAWEKYHFTIAYEREGPEGDPFTGCLFSLIGLGFPSTRDRLRVSSHEEGADRAQERTLARIEDLVLLHYGGLFAQRPRNASALGALLRDYLQLPAQIRQFQGQWLDLEPADRTRLGAGGSNHRLGVTAVAGRRVWDQQSKIRVRLGPLRYDQFLDLLPDRAPIPERKAFFVLVHLVRLYIGPELDFEVQLVLKADDVPACQLNTGGTDRMRLGWNTWLRSRVMERDAEDAVFPGEEVR